jgi:hypothetical protein
MDPGTRGDLHLGDPMMHTSPSKRIEAGLPPARVTQAVLRAVTDRRPRLRYPVGREATWIPGVRKVAPHARFEATTRRMFGLDAAAGARAGREGAA